MSARLGSLLVLCVACGKTSVVPAADGPADAAVDASDAPFAPDAALDAASDVLDEGDAPPPDVGPDAVATCDVCTPAEYTCSSPAATESTQMYITAVGADSCTGQTQQGATYTIKCAPAEICQGSSCTTYDFENVTLDSAWSGPLLTFEQAGYEVTCYPSKG